MKKILLLAVTIFIYGIGMGQCPDSLITIAFQSDIDNFSSNYPDCTQIENGLFITGNNGPITNLNGLSQITSIFPFFQIEHTDLVNLEGLSQLEEVNSIRLEFNNSLTSTSGLGNFQFVSANISHNNALTDLTSFANTAQLDSRILEIRDNPQLSSLVGLEGITSLEELRIEENHSLVDFIGLENLNHIGGGLFEVVFNDNLESFNGLNNIFFSHTGGDYKLIQIGFNPQLTTIDQSFIAPGSTTRRIVITNNNNLTDLNGFLNLQYLDYIIRISSNDSLQDLSGLSNITNPIVEEIDIRNNDNLQNLSGLENYQTLINNGEGFVRISNNESLTNISSLSNLHIGNLNLLTIDNNTSLSMCSEENVCAHLLESGTAEIFDNDDGCNDIQEIENNCQELNFVTGNVRFDFDTNGCTPSDYNAGNILVEITDGNTIRSAIVNTFGHYSRPIGIEGTFEVSISDESLPTFFEVAPSSQQITFDGLGNEEIVDFCLVTTEEVNDLKITIIPIGDARPGFIAKYQVIYENIGTTVLDGVITLEFDDERQSFLQSIPNETSVNTSTITWDFSDLLPFESSSINLDMDTFTPPTNDSGDILLFETSISSSIEDDDPSDNIYILEQIVINSQDPNDKLVLQGESISPDEVGDYLDYIVRFENIGTASAVNVRVDDILSDQLDWSTFRILSSSHLYRTEIQNEQEVSFFFDNINLPPVQDNPELGQGYIAFQVRSNASLQIGDVIENSASIVFDFNAPIITNTVSTEVIDPTLSIADSSINPLISMYPNPVRQNLKLELKEGLDLKTIKVFSIEGQLIVQTNKQNIDFTEFKSGIYIVQIDTDKGILNKKVVKN